MYSFGSDIFNPEMYPFFKLTISAPDLTCKALSEFFKRMATYLDQQSLLGGPNIDFHIKHCLESGFHIRLVKLQAFQYHHSHHKFRSKKIDGLRYVFFVVYSTNLLNATISDADYTYSL